MTATADKRDVLSLQPAQCWRQWLWPWRKQSSSSSVCRRSTRRVQAAELVYVLHHLL